MRDLYHLVFATLFGVFTSLRMLYLARAARSMGRAEFRESKWQSGLRGVSWPLTMGIILAYIVRPDLFSWALLPLPTWIRWLGAGLGVASVALICWVQQALGSNFSPTLHIRENHTLVTHGPYQRVRHPMYTVIEMHLLGVLLLTANWFVGGPRLIMFTLLILARLKKEEALMIEKFGDRYREYTAHTGRLLPRLNIHSERD